MKVNVTKYKDGPFTNQRIFSIEEPIEIRIEGTPTAVLLRSPKDLILHMATYRRCN